MAKLASTKNADLLDAVSIEFLTTPSITVAQEDVRQIQRMPSWQDPIIRYLEEDKLAEDKEDTTKLQRKASRYTILDEQMYPRGFNAPLLHYVNEEKWGYILVDIHNGICGNSTVGQSLAQKVL